MRDEVRNGGRDRGDDSPEAQPRHGAIAPELDSHLLKLAGLGQEAAWEEGPAEPHPAVALNLRREEVKSKFG